jgi:ABC-type sugar transport system permease subunit
VLVAGALYALMFSYVRPTVWSIRTSTLAASGIEPGEGEPVGLQNYTEIAEQLVPATGFAQSLIPVPLLAIVVVAPLIAYAAHRAGRAGRWGTRLALTIPMVCFAPTALAIAWRLEQIGVEPPSWPASVRNVFWVTTFGMVCGLGVTLYLAALRRRDPDRATWPAGIATGAIAAIAVIAVVLQTFTYPLVLTAGGPNGQTQTPVFTIYDHAFRFLQFGASTAAATQVGIMLGLLGLAVALVVILTRMRIEVDLQPEPSTTGPVGVRIGAGIAAIFGVLVVLAIARYGLMPWATRLGQVSVEGGPSASSVLANTWVPTLLSSVTGVGIAAVAAFGIGMLRPLGRFSELLLLPFAPWLLVGLGPLSPAMYVAAQEGGLVDTFAGLVPPVLLSVPALFVLTALFRGQERRWHELAAEAAPGQGTGFLRALLPALPMVVLIGLATWLVQAQGILWPLLTAVTPEFATGPLVLWQQLNTIQASPDAVAIGLPFPLAGVVTFVAIFGVAQVLYLDRVAIRVGRE